MMISDRRKARTARSAKFVAWNEDARDLKAEAAIERKLKEQEGLEFEEFYAPYTTAWSASSSFFAHTQS
jgi:hypothetical protein